MIFQFKISWLKSHWIKSHLLNGFIFESFDQVGLISLSQLNGVSYFPIKVFNNSTENILSCQLSNRKILLILSKVKKEKALCKFGNGQVLMPTNSWSYCFWKLIMKNKPHSSQRVSEETHSLLCPYLPTVYSAQTSSGKGNDSDNKKHFQRKIISNRIRSLLFVC